MQAVNHLMLTDQQVSNKIRVVLSYCSILLFIGFTIFVTLSINKFVNDKMFITVVQPEAEAVPEELPEAISKTIIVQKGDTLNAILLQQKIPNNEIASIIKLIQDKISQFALKVGQTLIFDYEIKITEEEGQDLASESWTLSKLTIVFDKLNSLEIIRADQGFYAQNVVVALNKFLTKSSVVINSSFMAALKSLGLSNNSINELVNAYSYQIDFLRQIKNGDTVSVITEKFVTKDGNFSHHGRVLYVNLNLSGQEYNIYRYSPDNLKDNHSFFSEDGKSVKRSLLRNPVKFMRISSHYGMRNHPTLGYSKAHKGVDFAAPTGTPIYAAGNGVITEIGWKSGYGKWVQIKHSQTLSTSYAHASNFAKNLKVGSTVKQGQVIAYVGSTGRATGPHLHYEIKIAGKNVNPMHVKTTPGVELTGNKLAQFKQFKNKIKTLSNELDTKIEVADNADTKFF
ncbi:M23 family metallopeptidase [Candidatus Tisiphia endosymbiont of Nemotelus uliginosus]|uniref:M23 family metallopeptidase n=1 Tax=Candidatus Tisiphia endosymbiont of Nemotelus uliginosus TaxID=3077926 RepID=UPI0035C92EE7